MKFFFEQDGEAVEQPKSEDKEFFFLLKEAGIVQQPGDKPQDISSEAKMQTATSKLLSIEYGTYQDTYAVHITPTHPKRNISDEQKVYEALRELVIVMNEYVPQTLTVKLHPPRADWQMKVISAVVHGGAAAWNFDIPKFEAEGITKILTAIEKVIMK